MLYYLKSYVKHAQWLLLAFTVILKSRWMTTFKGVMRGGGWRALIGIWYKDERFNRLLSGNFICGFLRGKWYEFFSLFCHVPCRSDIFFTSFEATRYRTSFRPVENSYVKVFRSHGTTLHVRKFSSVLTEQKYWTVPCEQSVWSKFFNRSKIRPVPCEHSSSLLKFHGYTPIFSLHGLF